MEDLAKYIRSYKAIKEKPTYKSSIPDTESIDTNELLSEVSSEISSDVKPTKKTAIMSVQKLKQQRNDPRKRPKQQKRTPLKVVQEEDEAGEAAHSSYNLTDYLPREERDLTPSKTQPKQVRQPVRLKRPQAGRFTTIDPDAQSTISSVDTEALLKSSDEEDEDPDEDYMYCLPRSLPAANRQLTPPTQSRSTKASATPSAYSTKSDILEQIRNKTISRIGDEYGKPPTKEGKNKAYPSDCYSKSAYTRETESYSRKDTEDGYSKARGASMDSYQKTTSTDSSQAWSAPWAANSLSPHHNKRETADFRYPSKDSSDSYPVEQPSYPKSVSLSVSTHHTSIPPARRLQVVTVMSMAIVPGNTARSQASEFSLNDPLQSSRKFKVPSVPDTVRVYNSMASVPMDSVLRLSGADTGRSRESFSSSEEKSTPIQICTCILAGELRRHLPTCKKITISAMLPSERGTESLASSVASLPYRQQIQHDKPAIPKAKTGWKTKQKMSIVDATVKIQRAFRRFLRLRKPRKPIREIETWTLEEPLDHVSPRPQDAHATPHRPDVEPNLGDSEADRATRSLFHALDQLRALRNLASTASSRETSFTLSESAISREVTPGQSRIIQSHTPIQQVEDRAPSPQFSLEDDFQPGLEGDTSIDTDILLRSTDSVDFT